MIDYFIILKLFCNFNIPYSANRHETEWFSEIFLAFGILFLHSSFAYMHLVWNLHPVGISDAFGISPLIGSSFIMLTLPDEASGTAAIKALV